MRFDTKMPAPVATVTAGGTITFDLPIGRRYHALELVGGGAGLSFNVEALQEVRVLANSKIIQRFSGADRNAMNLFLGLEAAAIDDDNFNLAIYFDRYNLMTQAGETETAINTGSVSQDGRSINQFKLEVDIASSGFSGAPSLTMNAAQSEALPGGPGTIPYLLKSVRDFAAATDYEISELPRGGVSTQFIDQIFMKPSASTLDNFVVEANRTKLFERSAATNERRQRNGVRAPQAGWYVIDRTEHGYGGDPFDLRGLDDFRIKVTTGAAMQLTMYTAYLGGLTG